MAAQLQAGGRGAWPTSGAGGTLSYADPDQRGPYYRFRLTEPQVGRAGITSDDVNEQAVHFAVRAYQMALKRRLGIPLLADGVFGAQTEDAVLAFQTKYEDSAGMTVWGGIGPDTSKQLLMPDLKRTVRQLHHLDNDPWISRVPASVVCGTITSEVGWDAGAVGAQDEHDVGLGQINSVAHPDFTLAQRLRPRTAFVFITVYLADAMKALDGSLEDAVAAYNLGVGGWSEKYQRLVGARGWIADGRPVMWTPPGQTLPRKVQERIDTIMTVCT